MIASSQHSFLVPILVIFYSGYDVCALTAKGMSWPKIFYTKHILNDNFLRQPEDENIYQECGMVKLMKMWEYDKKRSPKPWINNPVKKKKKRKRGFFVLITILWTFTSSETSLKQHIYCHVAIMDQSVCWHVHKT